MKRSFRFGLLPIALALTGSLRADDQAAPAQHPDDVASLRADNKQLSDELASAWKEADRLKADLAAAQAASAKSEGEAADLRKQLDAAKAQAPKPEVEPAPSESDAAKQLADVQDKLSVSLRSFSVLQDENTQLKASVEKANADNASLSQQLDAARASIASLQAQAAATAQVAAQVEPLRSELRLSQDEANRLAVENAQFRTRLALQSPGPGSARPSPTRPGQAAAASAAPAEAAMPPAPPAPRTYVVVEGDTLTKISRKYYGTSGRWEDILKANRDVLKDEKSLVVGSTLKIP
jgi:nucleoid-associated protein YgaU